VLPAKERRARRRQRTLDIARARRDEHLKRNHFSSTTGLTEVDCVCELSNTYFAKRSAFGCSCSKRVKGRPKVASGMCTIDDRARIYQWRQERRALRGGFNQEEKYWPSTKKGVKAWVLEKRDLNRAGEPVGGWYAFRRYRTRQGADDALRSLQRSPGRSEFRRVD